jgi:AcrR family transcriptional regulator
MGVKERRAYEKQIRRNQILDAARKLLFAMGINRISISRIAKESQLGVGTIYFYFKNKEEIFAALQEEGLSFLYSIIEQVVVQGADPREQLKKIAWAYYDFSVHQTEYFNLINYFLASPRVFFPENLKTRIDLSGRKILGMVEQVVLQGIESSHFQESEPARFAIMFFGTLHGLLQFKKLEQTALKDDTHKDVYEYSVKKLIQGITPMTG